MATKYLEDTDTKLVNVLATVPVTTLKVPFIGEGKGMTFMVKEIREFLHASARVQEVIGTRIVPLGYNNYNTDNSVVVEEKEETPVVNVVTPTGVADAQAAQEAAILGNTAQEPTKETTQGTPTEETPVTPEAKTEDAKATEEAAPTTPATDEKEAEEKTEDKK